MHKDSSSNLSPKLRDIQAAFPLPGTYHFRFKCPLIPGADREKGAVAVWMDCVDPDQHVGVWRNSIFAKVTRINMTDEGDDDDEDFVRPTQRPAVQQQQNHQNQTAPQPQQMPVSYSRENPVPNATAAASGADSNLLGVFDGPSTHSSRSVDGDLLGGGVGASHHSSYASEASLLDMNGPATQTDANTSIHSDFFGLDATPVPTPPVSGNAPVQAMNMMNNNMSAGAATSRNVSSSSFRSDGPFGGLNW
jgi:hypothetical protein